MGLVAIIVYVSLIVWSLPPFRQYKGNFFNYFIIFAIGDPIGIFLSRLGYRNNHPVYALVAAAALISVMALNKNIKRIPAFSFLLFILFAGLLMPYQGVSLMTAAILIVLIYYFIRHMIIYVGKHGYVSLFHILFLIYNISLAFKLINLELELQKGVLYFEFTSLFEVVLGILFCFFREEDKLFSVKLRDPAAGKSFS